MLSRGKERKPYQSALQCSIVGFRPQRVEKSDGSAVDSNKEMHEVSLSERQKMKKTKERRRERENVIDLRDWQPKERVRMLLARSQRRQSIILLLSSLALGQLTNIFTH